MPLPVPVRHYQLTPPNRWRFFCPYRTTFDAIFTARSTCGFGSFNAHRHRIGPAGGPSAATADLYRFSCGTSPAAAAAASASTWKHKLAQPG